MATVSQISDEVISLWQGSGNFFQHYWDKFLDVVGEDDTRIWIHGTAIISTLTYWTVGGLFTYMDLTLKPQVLRKYKVQVGTNEPLDWQRFKNALKVIVFNQLIVGGIVLYIFYRMISALGLTPLRELPTFFSICAHLIGFLLLEEVFFYYSHRILHHKLFYKWIHKKHHEWTSPIAVTAIYCNPIEHVISNLMPVLLGVFVTRCHVVIAWIWFVLGTINTLCDHSGYHLPFVTSSEFHDFHHAKFNYNYGVLGLLDWLHGTDTAFRKSQAFKRHRLLVGLKSAREMFPDNTSNKKKKR